MEDRKRIDLKCIFAWEGLGSTKFLLRGTIEAPNSSNIIPEVLDKVPVP